jgi:hypothetical protein
VQLLSTLGCRVVGDLRVEGSPCDLELGDRGGDGVAVVTVSRWSSSIARRCAAVPSP